MPDLTPLEAAEKLEWMAKITEVDAFICNRDDIPLLKQSASYLRRVASGEYAPVIHGRWIHKDCNGIPTENHEAAAYAECSNCGHTVNNVDQEAERCPYCGALMDGKDDSHAPR